MIFHFRTLVTLTALFMSASTSLFAMKENFDEGEKQNPFSIPSLQKGENSEIDIEALSKHIDPKELNYLINEFLIVTFNVLAQRSYCIRDGIFEGKKEDHKPTNIKDASNEGEFLKTLNSLIEKERNYSLLFIKDENYQKKRQLINIHMKMIGAFSELKKNLTDSIEKKQNILLKEFFSFYENNSFYDSNPCVETPSLFRERLRVFFIERLSFDFINDLYKNSFQELELTQEIIHFKYLLYILPYAFPTKKEDVKECLTLDIEHLFKGTAPKQLMTKACKLFSLFKEDKEKKGLRFLYYLTTRFLSQYAEPINPEVFPIIPSLDDKGAHLFANPFVSKEALGIKLHLKSLFLSSLQIRSLSNIKGSREKYKNTKNFHTTELIFESGVNRKVLHSLAQELIIGSKGNIKKQELFMEALQTAIICLGLFHKTLSDKEFNENIDLLSSVKYEVDFNLNPEVQQNFRKLEILRHVVLYYLKDIELKKTKDKTPHLKESLLSILETFIFHVNKFKEKNMIKNKKLSEILSLDIFPFSIKLLSTKNQLEKKYNLLEELGKDEEAEAVYQEYKKEAKRQKDNKKEKKKESLKSQKTTSKGKIIKQRVEMKKNKKENLEKSSQQSRDMVEKNKKDRPQPSYNHQNTSTYVLSNDKFIISNNTKKEKRKNEIDHNHVNEKEEKKRNRKIGIKTNQDLKKEDKFIKNSVLVSNNENYKTKEENSKDRFYSKKAEKLSPNAKDILAQTS